MRTRTIFQAAIWLAVTGIFSPALPLTQEELVAKVQAAGYSQVSDIKSTAEGISVKAMKNGKEVRLVVDSSGQIKERELRTSRRSDARAKPSDCQPLPVSRSKRMQRSDMMRSITLALASVLLPGAALLFADY